MHRGEYSDPLEEYAAVEDKVARSQRANALPAVGPGAIVPGRPGCVLCRGMAAALVEMSYLLTPNQKRLYRRILELDRPKGFRAGGCFAKVETLARRLAMHPDVVTRTRRQLERLGLLGRSTGGASPVRWFPMLPAPIAFNWPEGMKPGRMKDEWLLRESHALDTALRARGAGRKSKRRASGMPRTNSLPEKDESSVGTGLLVRTDRTNSLAVIAEHAEQDAGDAALTGVAATASSSRVVPHEKYHGERSSPGPDGPDAPLRSRRVVSEKQETATAGIPGIGIPQPFGDPDGFVAGWDEIKQAAIQRHGGKPKWLDAFAKMAYRSHRIAGVPHAEILARVASGEPVGRP
jgi:hypothetical protein